MRNIGMTLSKLNEKVKYVSIYPVLKELPMIETDILF